MVKIMDTIIGVVFSVSLLMVAGVVAILYASGRSEQKQDDTPPIVAVIDGDTGCQYLYGGGHGITPRVNALGQHICNIKDEARK